MILCAMCRTSGRSWLACAAVGAIAAIGAAPVGAQPPFGPPRDLSGQRDYSIEPSAAIAPNGEAVVAWQRRIDDYNSVTEAVARHAGGRFGPPEAISSSVWHSNDARVAMDRKGNSVVVYRKGNDSGVYNLYAVFRPAGGEFTSPVKVSDDTGIDGTFVTS